MPAQHSIRERTHTLLARHRTLSILLALGALLRLAALVTYPSGLFFSDSWEYVLLAWERFPVQLGPDRPSGYPLALRILGFGHHILPILVAQNLAGLAIAVLVYALLLRFGVARALALAAAAILIFDGYALALEQHVMPETLFTLVLLGSLAILAGASRARWLALSGLLLAAAVSMRTVGVFAVPVWLVFLVWRRRWSLATLAGALALAVPLLLYVGAVDAKFGTFDLVPADGWFLYGRVGPIATCRGLKLSASERPLCTEAVQRPDRWADFYVFDRESPLNRLFDSEGPYFASSAQLRASNSLAQRFSLAVIRQRPGRYARLVLDDFLRFFEPGTPSHYSYSDTVLRLPAHRQRQPTGSALAAQRRVLPAYKPRAGPLAPALSDYVEVVHTPRWLLAATTLLALIALLAAAVRREQRRWRVAETLLFGGCGLAMLLGSALTDEFVLRYLLPVEPLLLLAGALPLASLWAQLSEAVGRPVTPSASGSQ